MKAPHTKKSILVAVTPRSRETAAHALECADFDVTFCHSLLHAQHLLDQPFDAIVCTLQFDDSRLFDLLKYVKTHPTARAVPFVALKIGTGVLSDEAVETQLSAAKLCGATDSINLPEWRDELGDEPAFEKLRACIRQLAL